MDFVAHYDKQAKRHRYMGIYGVQFEIMRRVLNMTKLKVKVTSTPVDVRQYHMCLTTQIMANAESNPRVYPQSYYSAMTYTRTSSMVVEAVAVPFMETSINQFNSDSLILIIFVVSFIMLSFWLVVKFLNLDTTTWNYLLILGIQFGIGHARELVSAIEQTLYMTLFAVGFFFAGDIFFTLTDVVNVVKEEVKIQNFIDLNDTGLSVFAGRQLHDYYKTLSHEEYSQKVLGEKLQFEGVTGQVSGGLCLKWLVTHKNACCISNSKEITFLVSVFNRLGRKSIARVAPVHFSTLPKFHPIHSYCPYYHCISHYLMIYFETALETKWYKMYKRRLENFIAHQMLRELSKIEQDQEESTDESINWEKLFILLVIGLSATMISLLVEHLILL